ncbi:MAG: VOC family protein [Bacteroidales bacterium]|nr:VOC family protein [Bacteroidales bacterium]
MLQHIALTVNDSGEIRNFYEDVLGFRLVRKFSLERETIRNIFHEEDETDVYLMGHDGIELELFLSPLREKKVFSHVCLLCSDAEMTARKASGRGYELFTRENRGKQTYFIWDKSRNMFEIKGIID